MIGFANVCDSGTDARSSSLKDGDALRDGVDWLAKSMYSQHRRNMTLNLSLGESWPEADEAAARCPSDSRHGTAQITRCCEKRVSQHVEGSECLEVNVG